MEQFLYERKIKNNPELKAVFAFPAIESFALSSLGYLSIFKDIDEMENVFIERFYANSKTTKTPIQEIKVVGFSFSFELDIFQIFKILDKFNIPYLAKDRNENHPLIFAGGPVITSNPLPYQDFFDFVNIGDSNTKKTFEKIIEKKSCPKEEILKAISDIQGVWVCKYENAKPVERNLQTLDKPFSLPILSENSFFKNTFIIELERGCPKMCKFCLASWHNLPFRSAPKEKIIKEIENALQYTNKIALLGAYVAGHPDFEEILDFIAQKNKEKPIELTLSSLRADLTSEKTVKTLVECGAKTATVAIEAGSERLRKFINKDLSEEQILKTVKTAREGGLSGLKFYLMIGHPTETQADIEEIITLLKKIKKENKGFELSISLNTFIPKPHTPFENVIRENKKSLEKKIQYLKKHLHILGIKLSSPSVEWDGVQSLLSRFPKSMSEYLIDVYKNGGKLGAFRTCWRDFAKKNNLENFEKTIENPLGMLVDFETMPWNFIQINDKKNFEGCYKE